MQKEIKNIKLVEINGTEMKFELKEDAKAGDYFILNKSLDQNEHEKIASFVLEFKNNLDKKIKEQWENEFEETIENNVRFVRKYQQKEKELLKEFAQKFESEIEKVKGQIEASYKNKEKEIFLEIDNLKKSNKSLENQIFQEKEKFQNDIFNARKLALSEAQKEAEEKLKQLKEQNEKFNDILKQENQTNQNLNKQIITLNDEIKKMNASFLVRQNELMNKIEKEKKALSDDLIKQKNEEINKLNQKNSEFNNELKNQIELLKSENKNLESENKKLEGYIDGFKDQRRIFTANVKQAGEEYEMWVNNILSKKYSFDQLTEVKKATKVMEKDDGSKGKPDFYVTYNNSGINNKKQMIGKVVIEVKSLVKNTGQKNEKFLKKLEEERKKSNSDFAILVTELEPEKTFFIEKDKNIEYRNIFIVRDQFLELVLDIIHEFIKKKAEVNKLQKVFKDKKIIIEEFEKFKENMLNNSLKHIESNLEIILKKANDISKASKAMQDSINIILNTHLSTVRNKIISYDILKVTNNIEQAQRLQDFTYEEEDPQLELEFKDETQEE